MMTCDRYLVWFLTFGQALALLMAAGSTDQVTKYPIGVKFDVKDIPGDPLYSPISRFEYSERNTSAAYDLWNQTNITLVEWPGKVTQFEPSWPLLKWQRPKAKLVKNQCCVVLGMHFYGYAHEYVHLTWGPFRITTSYCPPLKIPRSIFNGNQLKSSDSSTLLVSDFEFVSDAFLIIVDNSFVVRVSRLEASFLEEGVLKHDRSTLSYSLATGISHKIYKLVTQACCISEPTCRYGNTALAYGTNRDDFSVFLSFDGGKHFKLTLSSPPSLQLRTLIAFPQIREILLFYGGKMESQVEMGRYFIKTGNLTRTNVTLTNVKGELQAMRLGEEASFLIWDNCRIWYSPDAGTTLKPAAFYYHLTIPRHTGSNRQETNKHVIQSHNCHLVNTSVAYDASGKIGLLDSINNFFYGIDLKASKYEHFPLVATNVDMTLMKKGTENSIVPNFDINGRPKLMYPPKYLHCNHPAVNDEKFPKRLAVKLLPKTIFPSDFMAPFYDEHISKQFGYLGLQKCLSSGFSIDSSLSQTPQVFTTPMPVKFQLEFKSFLNSTKLLHIEPQFYKDLLNVNQTLVDQVQLGTRKYFYYKYIITITVKQETVLKAGDVIRLNFYTTKSLRCVHQPQQTIWIRITKPDDFAAGNRRNEGIPANSALELESDPDALRLLRIQRTDNDNTNSGQILQLGVGANIQECGATYN